MERYYADRLARFGPTPQGVDWKSAESQALRFDRLLLLLDEPETDDAASLNDFGAGYGALLDHLRRRGRSLRYRGFDISDAMVTAAAAVHADEARSAFSSDAAALHPADYTVASGVFNVKLEHRADDWYAYVLDTLATLHALSTRGFAFNMLSTYSDPEKRRDILFYMDPVEMFDVCRRRFSPRVALLHDYPLFEFTILVRS